MALVSLFKTEVMDRFLRENFARLERYLNDDVFAKGRFKFMSLAFSSDTAIGYAGVLSVPHNLGFQPKDVVVTSVIPSTVTVAWKYEQFTTSRVYATVSAACTIRAYVGRYEEGA